MVLAYYKLTLCSIYTIFREYKGSDMYACSLKTFNYKILGKVCLNYAANTYN